MRLQQYYIHQEKYEEHPLFDKTIEFVKESFSEIAHMYREDNVFKKRVQGNLKEDILSDKDSQIFYIVQDTKDDIIGCLWGVIYEDYAKDTDTEKTNFFLSSYLSIDKLYRREGLGSKLKTTFEELANQKREETQKNTIVRSCVHKNNIPSQQRNLKNGYVTKNHGNQPTDSEYIKYYKGDFI